MAADQIALAMPSTSSGANYLINDWNAYAPSTSSYAVGLSENLTDVNKVVITPNSSGLAQTLELFHATGGTATYNSVIDVSQSNSVTDLWENPTTNAVAFSQTINGTSMKDTIYLGNQSASFTLPISFGDGSDTLSFSGHDLSIATSPGSLPTNIVDYGTDETSGDTVSLSYNSDGSFNVNTGLGEGDFLEVTSDDNVTGEDQNFTFSGGNATLQIDEPTSGAPATNYVIDSATGADLTTDTISFDGQSIAGDINPSMTDKYGRTYALSGTTLTVTETQGSMDTLTIDNFQQGDFGVNDNHPAAMYKNAA